LLKGSNRHIKSDHTFGGERIEIEQLHRRGGIEIEKTLKKIHQVASPTCSGIVIIFLLADVMFHLNRSVWIVIRD
jgi:hypothetical protein